MSENELDEMGPIDYLLVEWKGKQPTGEAAPILVDLVERGVVRVLDLAFITKAEDGSVAGIDIAELGQADEELKVFEGASSGLLGDDDIEEAASALEPGTSAALLRLREPLGGAVRGGGAPLRGRAGRTGRIPVQALLAAVEAAEATA